MFASTEHVQMQDDIPLLPLTVKEIKIQHEQSVFFALFLGSDFVTFLPLALFSTPI